LWNGEPATFHLLKIALILSTCAAIAWVTLTYQRALGAFSPALAAFGAAFWVVAPWSLGYSLWATAAFANHSVLLLCLAAIALLRLRDTRAILPLAGCLLAYAAALFTFQSTWFAIFPFLMVLALREIWHRRPLLPAIGAGAALVLVQAAAMLHSWMLSPKKP